MTSEVITLIRKIAELTKDDPTAVTYTNGKLYWIIINNHPCIAEATNDAIYLLELTEKDLEM